MKRLFTACLAAAALSLSTAGSAFAAPKAAAGDQPCAAAVGTPVCCKASVANHCGYTSCCEVGNAGFFSKSHCATCEKHATKAKLAAHKSCAATHTADHKAVANAYVSCCEEGNGGFFKAHAGGSCAAAKSGASCCEAKPAKSAKK